MTLKADTGSKMIEIGITKHQFYAYLWYTAWIIATVSLFTNTLWIAFGILFYIIGGVIGFFVWFDYNDYKNIDNTLEIYHFLPFIYPFYCAYVLLSKEIKFKD